TLEVCLRLSRDMTNISGIRLSGNRITDIADQDQRPRLGKRVQKRRAWVWTNQHVAFLNGLKAPYGRSVKPNAFSHAVEIEGSRRNREVLPETRDVRKPKI